MDDVEKWLCDYAQRTYSALAADAPGATGQEAILLAATAWHEEGHGVMASRERRYVEQIEDLTSINEGHVEDKVSLSALIRELRDKLAAAAPDEPRLGLADTEMLMRELITRFTMNMYGEHTKMLDFERALTLAEMLGGLSAPEKEYRPVDHG